MTTWIDAHNHLQDPRLGEAASVIDAMRRIGVTSCVVNATCESDWVSVASLVRGYPDFVVPAFGIHPWKVDSLENGWQDRLVKCLEEFPSSVIGEIGLDQWVESPSIDVQRAVFEDQLTIGRQMKRPVTIHCLKAWSVLFEVFEACPPPSSFLMHSFGGSIEVAKRLIPLGAYFSFSGYFLHEQKAKVLEVFRQLPRERILLETDAPDMLPPDDVIKHPLAEGINHPANLPAIGRGLAAALAMDVTELAELTGRNASACFGI